MVGAETDRDDMNLAAFLLAVARQQPDRPAVTEGGKTWSYGAFFDRVGAIAGSLQTRGLEHGDRVVLWMENSAEFVEALFGCWTAGLCAVPVNAKLHRREVAHVVADSGATLIFTTPGLVEDAAGVGDETSCTVVCARTDGYERLVRATAIEPVAAEPDELAWIFYTSGTTGRPKGAMLSHRNLLGMSLRYLSDVSEVASDEVKLHTAPLSHASGLYGLPFFLKGAHHVILPGFDVDAIAAMVERYDDVTMFAAPTMLTRLVNSSAMAAIDPARLKTIYYGGGPMYVADLERALEIFGPRLYQLYGQGESPMTITGLGKLQHLGTEGPSRVERLASCGVPRTGVLVRVVDDDDRDLPCGEVGEVITRSDCVMLGYWGNTEASAAALRGGWLHTGDLGSLDQHGYLTLRDRSKDMIISGGSNIYPREIEEVLLRHPALLEVSVVGRPHPEWGEEVVAFVVAKPNQKVATAELDQLCLDNIARFKRPKQYRFLDSLPKNNYGKILKTELRWQLEEEHR
jgi:acyl-CoA synthetase (AMP-forming)/AMP-acid ligase II